MIFLTSYTDDFSFFSSLLFNGYLLHTDCMLNLWQRHTHLLSFGAYQTNFKYHSLSAFIFFPVMDMTFLTTWACGED